MKLKFYEVESVEWRNAGDGGSVGKGNPFLIISA